MSAKKAFKNFAKFVSPSSMILDKVGVSDSNALRQITNPGGAAIKNLNKSYQEGGTKGALNAIKRGDVTDPGGWFHDMSGPIPDPGEAPTKDATTAGLAARDRIRRLAYRAQGRASTIKVGAGAEQYTGQQKALLGS